MSTQSAIEVLKRALDRVNEPMPEPPPGRDPAMHCMGEYAERVGFARAAMQIAVAELEAQS